MLDNNSKLIRWPILIIFWLDNVLKLPEMLYFLVTSGGWWIFVTIYVVGKDSQAST